MASAATGKSLGQLRRLLDHRNGISEQDHCLIFLGRGRVDLGARLIVADQSFQPDAGGQGRLARALSALDIHNAKATIPILRLPTKDAADDEFLPGQQLEGQPFELPTIELQNGAIEANGLVGLFQIPDQPALRSFL
ncbi:hypothetical protein D3C81_1222290 [compost metagenome]